MQFSKHKEHNNKAIILGRFDNVQQLVASCLPVKIIGTMNMEHSASFSQNTHSKLHKLQCYNDFTSRILSPWPMHAWYLELGWVCTIYKNWCVVAMVVLISDFVFGHAIVFNWSVRHVWHYSVRHLWHYSVHHLWMQITYPSIVVPWPSLVWTPDHSDWGRRKGLGNNLAQTEIP